jgi:hypothetical protein
VAAEQCQHAGAPVHDKDGLPSPSRDHHLPNLDFARVERNGAAKGARPFGRQPRLDEWHCGYRGAKSTHRQRCAHQEPTPIQVSFAR